MLLIALTNQSLLVVASTVLYSGKLNLGGHGCGVGSLSRNSFDDALAVNSVVDTIRQDVE